MVCLPVSDDDESWDVAMEVLRMADAIEREEQDRQEAEDLGREPED